LVQASEKVTAQEAQEEASGPEYSASPERIKLELAAQELGVLRSELGQYKLRFADVEDLALTSKCNEPKVERRKVRRAMPPAPPDPRELLFLGDDERVGGPRTMAPTGPDADYVMQQEMQRTVARMAEALRQEVAMETGWDSAYGKVKPGGILEMLTRNSPHITAKGSALPLRIPHTLLVLSPDEMIHLWSKEVDGRAVLCQQMVMSGRSYSKQVSTAKDVPVALIKKASSRAGCNESTVMYREQYNSLLEVGLANEEGSVLQTYQKPSGTRPTLLRAVWRLHKATYAWLITATDLKFSPRQPDSYALPTGLVRCRFDKRTGAACQEASHVMSSLVKWMELRHPPMRFTDLVADFIESDGLIWFVQVKGFKLAPAPW